MTRSHVLDIARRYVLEDLLYHPISARQFGRYLLAAVSTLHHALVDGVLVDCAPCLSNVMLKDKADEELKARELRRINSLITALLDDDTVNVMLPLNLGDATLDCPLEWRPEIRAVVGISTESIDEQSRALDCCLSAVDKFMTLRPGGVKFPCLVGRAGSGKSHILKLATAYALSKGLSVQWVSWTSERARQLGGSHLHVIFPFSVLDRRVASAQTIVSIASRSWNGTR